MGNWLSTHEAQQLSLLSNDVARVEDEPVHIRDLLPFYTSPSFIASGDLELLVSACGKQA